MSANTARSLALWALAVIPGGAMAAPNDPGKSGFQRFSGGPATAPIMAAAERPKPKPAAPEPPKPGELAAAMRAQEEANLMRRLAACDRIKQIALETGDSQMEAQAIRLEERATEVYKQRSASLPLTKPAASRGEKP